MKRAEELQPQARPQPSESSLGADAAEAVARWCLLLVCSGWELVLVLGFLLAGATALGLPAVVIVVVLAVVLAAVLVGVLADVPPLRAWWGRVQARYRARRLRQRWPDLALHLGWDVAFGDQRRRVPELVRVVTSPEQVVVELRPLAQHKRERWGDMCDQLRRQVGAPVARWSEVRPGVLAIFLATEPLPALAPFPTAGPSSWDRLRLGVRAGRDEVAWQPSDTPHLLLGGVTKGGKGSAIRNVAYDALAAGWQVVVVNPKLSGEYGWLNRAGVPVLEALEDVVQAVEWFEAERQRRQVVVKTAGVGSWERVPGWEAAPLLLIVDEVSALLMVDKANKDVAKVQERLSYLVTRLVQLGRSAGIHLVLATQRPDVATLGPNGGILRDNIDGRVGVCSLQDEGLRMLFGTNLDPDIKGALDGTKGRALATMLSAGDFDVYSLQLYYLDEAELLQRAVAPAVPQLLHLPLIAPPV